MARDRQHVGHIKRHLGSKLITEIDREDLFRYKNDRAEEYIIRNAEAAKTKVSLSTIRLESSCLRRMMNLASQKGIKTPNVSFRGVLPAVLDEENGVIVPPGGRCKTEVTQVAPLTDRFREIVSEIRQEWRRSKVKNIGGLVFTREDGRRIDKDMITGTLKRACKKASVSDFRFHDFRHCAKTAWARRGVGVEAAMLAAGHASPQMHQHYIHLQRSDVAKAFGILQHGCNTDSPAKSVTNVTS